MECFDSQISILQAEALGRTHDFEINEPLKLSVKGRLRKNLSQWREISAPMFILNIIEFGYKLPLLTIPQPKVFSNNRSALNESDFVQCAILSLLESQCVKEVPVAPEIVNPLSVSVNRSGKKRLILDLRYVNKHLFKNKFKCEDIAVARELLGPSDFMFSFDLKSGYHHVDIFLSHCKYLSFSWNFSNGVTRYFMFTVLPFGLSTAPYIFTKLLKPIVKKWRREGKSVVLYLDDGLCSANSYNSAKLYSMQVRADLLRFGFLPNEEKSQWEPCRCIVWLGTVLNTANCTIAATDKRIQSLKSDLDEVFNNARSSFHVKKIVEIVGKIISLCVCVGNVTRLMTRNLYSIINSSASWYDYVKLTNEAVFELKFWKDNVCKLNGIPLWPIVNKPHKIIYSDASSVGCGGVIAIEGKVFHQNWSEEERKRNSTFRELLAVSLAVEAFGNELKSQTLAWFTDNQNVVSIVQKGSKVPELQAISLRIFQTCMLNCITIDINWIPRSDNYVADEISKIIDYDDFTINDDVFTLIDEAWGPHTVDRFACHYNAKLSKFNSRFYQPGTSGVNAFSQDWAFENNWLCPPVFLTAKVIKHLELCKARGTLVVPFWTSAHFWTIICKDGVHFSSFIHDWFLLPHIPNLFIRGKAKNCIFGNGQLNFMVLALRIDFFRQPRISNLGFCTDFEGNCLTCSV